MFKFHCEGCGKKYKVEDDWAGKKIKCKACNHTMCISDDSSELDPQNIELQENDQIDSAIPIPIWARYLIGVLGVVFVSFILWLLVFRDTWETDNYIELNDLISEVQDHIFNNDSDSAIEQYDQLASLVGDRQLETKSFREDFASLQPICLKFKQIKAEEDKRILAEKKLQAKLALIEKQRLESIEDKIRQEEKARKKKLAEIDAVKAKVFGSIWVTKGSGQSNIIRGQKVYLLKVKLSDEVSDDVRNNVLKEMNDHINAIDHQRDPSDSRLMRTSLRENLDTVIEARENLISNDKLKNDINWLFSCIRISQICSEKSQKMIFNHYFGKGETWPEIVSHSIVKSAETDVNGRYQFESIPWGEYYVYSMYNDRFSIAEWLVKITVKKSGRFKIDLKNNNAEHIHSKPKFYLDQ